MIKIPNSSNNGSAKAGNRLVHDKFMFAARTRQNIDVKHKSIIVLDNDPDLEQELHMAFVNHKVQKTRH